VKPSDLDPVDVQRATSDTGYLCRNWLGMNVDADTGQKPGEGGIRDWGPHQEVVRVFDDPSVKRVVVLMPRNSYKSSIVKGLIVRTLIADPNATILLDMHDMEMAKQRVGVIRDLLLENEKIRALHGDMRGSVWRQNEFVTSIRSDRTLDAPSLCCCSREAPRTGGHFKLIIMDDIIDDQASRTEEGIESSKRSLRYLMPLTTPQGKIIDVGTLYAEGDVHHFLLELPEWHKVVHEVGYELERDETGRMVLTGEEPYFKFLTKKFLMSQLSSMQPRIWLSQYKNRLIGTGNEVFRREEFQPIAWKEELRNLTGYLLTDTASSEKKEGCYSVLAYVGLDDKLRVHILDLQIGHWQPDEFITRFFDMRARWTGKVNHQAELMEVTQATQTFRPFMEKRMRENKVVLNLLMLPRNSSEQTKDTRILRLQPRFQGREVYVCDTVPREFVDLGETKRLWDPEGYRDPKTGIGYPSGELVKQFINFRQWGKSIRDVPDAIAEIDEINPKTGERFCFYRKPTHLITGPETSRTRIDGAGTSSVGWRKLRGPNRYRRRNT
jgi:hypothetical protein